MYYTLYSKILCLIWEESMAIKKEGTASKKEDTNIKKRGIYIYSLKLLSL